MPEETLGELAKIEGLAPKEAVLARALVRYKLAPPEQILEMARATAAEPTGKGLLERLCAEGVITEERARQVEQALEKKLAGRQPVAAKAPSPGPSDDAVEEAEAVEDAEPIEKAKPAKTAEPPPEAAPAGEDAPLPKSGDAPAKKRRPISTRSTARMWKPRSGRQAETSEGDISLQGQMKKRRDEKETEALDKFIETYIRSRLHQLIMEKLTIMRAGVADPKTLAKTCGAKEKEILNILRDWRARGLLRTVHTFPYYYDPLPKVQETAELFMKAWRDETQHSHLLKKILEFEG